MVLSELELRNFRNYDQLKINLAPEVNIFFGQNAQGKTNLLEAISLVSIGKSFRSKKEQDFISWEQESCYLKGIFDDQAERQQIEIGIGRQEKRLKINGQISQSRDFPKIPVVIFSPDDLQMIKGGPQLRRDFIDFYLVQLEPHYRFIYYNYYKVLQQRNKYLKEGRKDRELLETWNEQLIEKGIKVIKYRVNFIARIHDAVIRAQDRISSHAETVSLSYQSLQNQVIADWDEDGIRNEFRRQLENLYSLEIERGVTLIGPHRDDLLLLFHNQAELRSFGSQGQQRTMALALKLGLIEEITASRGVPPLILLDDVMSEFDDQRKKALLQMLISSAQTFLTSTDRRDFPVAQGESLFLRIDKGTVGCG